MGVDVLSSIQFDRKSGRFSCGIPRKIAKEYKLKQGDELLFLKGDNENEIKIIVERFA